MARKSRKNVDATNELVYEFVTYNTALYIRLSVEDNKKRGNSIETQKSILENFIALHPELRLYAIYIDNGTTGTNFERPEFKRMMSDVEAGKVNCIIVKDLSRLGRNAIDTGFYIEKYFPLNKVRFISVNDNFDTDNNDGGGIILPLKNMINEAYSIDIGRKIKAQAQQSMKAGDFIGARPPYGFSKSPDNCHKLIIDEITAPVVKQIFEWAYKKMGLNDIVKRLNEANILPPSNYAHSKGIITHENLIGSGKWQTRTVSKILAYEGYVGDMVQGKSKSVNHKQIPVSEENWIIVRDTHAPIISRDVFAAVKAYREQVSAVSVQREINPYSENIFKGKIFCGDCNKNLHRQRNTRKLSQDVYFYHCISNDRIAKGTCAGVTINEVELSSTVLTVLLEKAKVITGKHLLLQQNETSMKTKQSTVKTKISALKQDIEKNRRFLRGLYESLVKCIITSDEYFELKAGYEVKITSSLNSISSLEKEQKELDTQKAQFYDLAGSIESIDGNTKLTAVLVEKLIDKVFVYADKRIEIVFRFENEFNRIDEVVANA